MITHDWPVKKAKVNLPVRLKGNLKCISGNLLSPVRAQNKAFGAASQMLLSRVRLQYVCSAGKVFGSKCSLKTLLYVWLPLLYNHYVLVVAAQLCFSQKISHFFIWKLQKLKTWHPLLVRLRYLQYIVHVLSWPGRKSGFSLHILINCQMLRRYLYILLSPISTVDACIFVVTGRKF